MCCPCMLPWSEKASESGSVATPSSACPAPAWGTSSARASTGKARCTQSPTTTSRATSCGPRLCGWTSTRTSSSKRQRRCLRYAAFPRAWPLFLRSNQQPAGGWWEMLTVFLRVCLMLLSFVVLVLVVVFCCSCCPCCCSCCSVALLFCCSCCCGLGQSDR